MAATSAVITTAALVFMFTGTFGPWTYFTDEISATAINVNDKVSVRINNPFGMWSPLLGFRSVVLQLVDHFDIKNTTDADVTMIRTPEAIPVARFFYALALILTALAVLFNISLIWIRKPLLDMTAIVFNLACMLCLVLSLITFSVVVTQQKRSVKGNTTITVVPLGGWGLGMVVSAIFLHAASIFKVSDV